MAKSKTYAYSGCIFLLVAVAVTARHDVIAGTLLFMAAIACGLRARYEWKREQG